MTARSNHIKSIKKHNNSNESMVDSVKILSDFTRKDIEKSYNLNTIRGTEAYYSNRYGWTLRRSIS